jgi:CHASE3 domain sensor protein
MSIKNSSDTLGDQTRDLLACNAVSQLIAPSRALMMMIIIIIIIIIVAVVVV